MGRGKSFLEKNSRNKTKGKRKKAKYQIERENECMNCEYFDKCKVFCNGKKCKHKQGKKISRFKVIDVGGWGYETETDNICSY